MKLLGLTNFLAISLYVTISSGVISPASRLLGNCITYTSKKQANLLANALKFFDESRPCRIRIYSRSLDDQSVYCVEDNGIGIAPEHQEEIFEMFYELEPEKRKGDGLGLTIVKRIIDRHNGGIWVESEKGKGSKFCVSLPIA